MIRDAVRRDRPMKLLQTYVSDAIEKVSQGQADTVSATLAEIMPSILTALGSLAISDDATTAQRKFALEAILSVFARVMTLRLRDQKIDIAKEKEQAKRQLARVDLAKIKLTEKAANLKIAAAQRKIGRRLAAAEKSIGGQLEETD